MLIESLVRKTLDVKDHRVVSVKSCEAGLDILLDRKGWRKLPCSVCGQRAWTYDRLKERQWKHVPLWGIPTTIRYQPRRVRCKTCGIKVERHSLGSDQESVVVALGDCAGDVVEIVGDRDRGEAV